jgi:hypothetical protein
MSTKIFSISEIFTEQYLEVFVYRSSPWPHFSILARTRFVGSPLYRTAREKLGPSTDEVKIQSIADDCRHQRDSFLWTTLHFSWVRIFSQFCSSASLVQDMDIILQHGYVLSRCTSGPSSYQRTHPSIEATRAARFAE